jgi:hypothetical protein
MLHGKYRMTLHAGIHSSLPFRAAMVSIIPRSTDMMPMMIDLSFLSRSGFGRRGLPALLAAVLLAAARARRSAASAASGSIRPHATARRHAGPST